MISVAVLVANLLAVLGTYMIWDVGAWWREERQGGSFRTVTGVVVATLGAVTLYITICYQVLKLSSQVLPG